jgi:hypothetical protein
VSAPRHKEKRAAPRGRASSPPGGEASRCDIGAEPEARAGSSSALTIASHSPSRCWARTACRARATGSTARLALVTRNVA